MAIGIPNINLDLSALANLQNRLPPDVAKNIPTGFGGFFKNIANIANIAGQQQEPVLGPDDFGSYTIPMSDPTYRSGFDYARSIAGGIPMSQVIAPGVSYSPEQPMGYTQEQLNIPKDVERLTPPPILPPTRKPDDPSFLGTGIGGVRIPVDRDMKMPPLRDIFGGMVDTRGQRERGEVTQRYVPGGGGIDYGGGGFFDDLLSLGIKIPPTAKIPPITQIPPRPIEVLPQRRPIPPISIGGPSGGGPINIGQPVTSPIDTKLPSPDLSQFARLEDIPTVPTFDREALIRDIRSGIDIPQPPSIDREALIRDITSRIDIPKPPSIDRQALIEDIRSGIELPTYQAPDLSGFARLEDIPKIPSREDFLSIAREGIEIPQYQTPDLSGFARLEDIPTFDPNVLKQDILMSIPQQQVPDVSQFVTQEDIQKAISGIDIPTYQTPDLSGFARLEDIPTFDPSGLQQQISGLQQQFGSITPFDASALQQQIAANQAAIAGINIPTYQAPDLSAYDARIAELEQQLAGLQTPTGGRFSVDQQLPRGLF